MEDSKEHAPLTLQEAIEERAPLSIEQAEKVRDQLSITQKFMGQCLGLSGGAWYNWVHKGRIPVEHHRQIQETFIAIRHMQAGGRVVPLDSDGAEQSPEREIIRDAVQVLGALQNGRMSLDNRIIRESEIRSVLLTKTRDLLEKLLV